MKWSQSWKEYVEANRDEIALIHVLYSQPKGARVAYAELRSWLSNSSGPRGRGSVT